MTRTPILIATLIATALAAPAVLAQGQGQGKGPGNGQGGGIMEFVTEWDMNGDGAVRLADMAERRLSQFEMFDLDGNGTIDAAEIANMSETVTVAEAANHGDGGKGGGHGAFGPGARIHAAMTADYTDTDKDGTLSQTEWEAATERLFTDLDRNGDGVLEPADLRPQG